MCQLLGMNCNVPTDMCFSMEGFYLRAGQTDQHCDGCGLVFFEGKGCRVFRDTPLSALQSPIAQQVKTMPLKTHNAIAHIRKATQGNNTLENTHPFLRELWGENWAFAHNGDLKILPKFKGNTAFYHPIGTTDSEQAFCFLLNNFRNEWQQKPTIDDITQLLQELSRTLQEGGTFNFLLSNGEMMWAFCTTDLYFITRSAPFGEAKRIDDDGVIDFRTVTTEADKVTVIATKPLTKNECWTALQKGELALFHQGERII